VAGLRKNAASSGGFSLLEVLVAATLLAVAVIGTGHLFVAGQGGLEQDEWLRVALQRAAQKLEELKGLSPADPRLAGEPDPGREHREVSNPVVLDDRSTVDTSDDLVGHLRWTVLLLDEPLSGEGDDYLLVRVEVNQDPGFSSWSPRIVLETILAR
jgi:prepilin-type N-terminal cleavage/methylation domain-containing protein